MPSHLQRRQTPLYSKHKRQPLRRWAAQEARASRHHLLTGNAHPDSKEGGTYQHGDPPPQEKRTPILQERQMPLYPKCEKQPLRRRAP